MSAARVKIALYLRVSTKDGRQETDNQRFRLRRLAESQDWEIVHEYEDRGPGAAQMMLEELQRRNYSQTTVRDYLGTVEDFAQHFRCSPDQVGPGTDPLLPGVLAEGKEDGRPAQIVAASSREALVGVRTHVAGQTHCGC